MKKDMLDISSFFKLNEKDLSYIDVVMPYLKQDHKLMRYVSDELKANPRFMNEWVNLVPEERHVDYYQSGTKTEEVESGYGMSYTREVPIYSENITYKGFRADRRIHNGIVGLWQAIYDHFGDSYLPTIQWRISNQNRDPILCLDKVKKDGLYLKDVDCSIKCKELVSCAINQNYKAIEFAGYLIDDSDIYGVVLKKDPLFLLSLKKENGSPLLNPDNININTHISATKHHGIDYLKLVLPYLTNNDRLFSCLSVLDSKIIYDNRGFLAIYFGKRIYWYIYPSYKEAEIESLDTLMVICKREKWCDPKYVLVDKLDKDTYKSSVVYETLQKYPHFISKIEDIEGSQHIIDLALQQKPSLGSLLKNINLETLKKCLYQYLDR